MSSSPSLASCQSQMSWRSDRRAQINLHRQTSYSSQTCKRSMAISKLKSVWTTACVHQVLLEGFPFPNTLPSSIEMPELEYKTRHAVYLGNKHRSSSSSIRKSRTWNANSPNSISDIHFIPGHEDRWLLTVSTGIWCGIACWDLQPSNSDEPRKLCEWGPRGTILMSRIIAVNSDPHSPVQLAIGIAKHEFVIFFCFGVPT